MKNLSTILLSSGATLFTFFCQGQTQFHSDTLFYTGSMQTYTVPDCATNIVIIAYGAQGANGSTVNPGINTGGLAGLGNRVVGGWSSLEPGSSIYVNVGGAANGATGGYNGGGNGNSSSGQNPSGGGGGATDVRFPSSALTDRVQVAGGGGGGGNAAYHWNSAVFTGGNGGNGGGNQALFENSIDGAAGTDAIGDGGSSYPSGLGGTSAGPGAGAAGCGSFLGQAGGSNSGEIGGAGGIGSSLELANYRAHGGAGGGGYVGGNGGGGGSAGTTGCSGNNIGAGGGGSTGTNYMNGEPKDFENGVREGDGMVVIQYSVVPEEVSLTSSIVPCVSQEVTLDFLPVGGTFTVLEGNSADLSATGVFTPSEEGTYEIVYTVIDVCTNEPVSDTLTLNITCDLAGLTEGTVTSLNVYPNPGSGVIAVSVNQATTAVFTNVNGAVLTNLQLNGATSIDVSNYASGVYFIHTAEGQTVKFIKE
jgi:hypothetical protein